MFSRRHSSRFLTLVLILSITFLSLGFVQQYSVAATMVASRTPRPTRTLRPTRTPRPTRTSTMTRTPTRTPTVAPTLVSADDLQPITADNANQLVELTAFKANASGTLVRKMAYSPVSGLIAIGDNKGNITLLSIEGFKQTHILKSFGEVQAIAFNPDGTELASASWQTTPATGSSSRRKTITLWDAQTGDIILDLEHTRRVQSLGFSPDGALLASGSGESGTGAEHDIYVWDARDGTQLTVLKGHRGIINNLRFSDDGSQIASASNDGTMRLWDATGETAHTVFQHTFALPDDPNQPMYGTWSGTGTIKGRTGNFAVSFTVSEDGTKILSSYLIDGRTLYLGGTIKIEDGIFTWRLTSASTNWQLEGEFVSQTELTGTVRSGLLQGEWSAKPTIPLVRDVAFSTDGELLISPYSNSRLLFWDVAAKKLRMLAKGSEVNDSLSSVTLTSDGSAVITVGTRLRVWDSSDGTPLFESDRLRSVGAQVVMGADDKLVIWMDLNGFIRLWGVPN